MYYLNSRYYDPETGRFISPDSLDYLDSETLGGINLYSYCNNNPVMFADPSGHFALLIFLGVVAISTISGAIDGGITAAMSGQDFWKGFAAGAISGAIGGTINYFLPGAGGLIGRSVGSFVYSITNEIFQTGSLSTNNLKIYACDVFFDVVFSLFYLDALNNIPNKIKSALIGGGIDAGVDIMETFLFFSPQAQANAQSAF